MMLISAIPLKEMLPIAKDIFQQWDLYINPTKTEFVHFYLAEPKPEVKCKVVIGKVYRSNEQCNSNKTLSLGLLICPIKDLKNYIFLSNVAFNKFANVWMNYEEQNFCRCKNQNLKSTSCLYFTVQL